MRSNKEDYLKQEAIWIKKIKPEVGQRFRVIAPTPSDGWFARTFSLERQPAVGDIVTLRAVTFQPNPRPYKPYAQVRIQDEPVGGIFIDSTKSGLPTYVPFFILIRAED